MARGVARSTRGGQGRRRISTGLDFENPRTRNRINRFFTPAQQRGDFTDTRSRPQVIAETARRGGRTGNAGGGSTGNAGGGSTRGGIANVARGIGGGQGTPRRMRIGFDAYNDTPARRRNRLNRYSTAEFLDPTSRRTMREARRSGLTANAGGGGGRTGNAGGGSTSGDPHQNRGSRRAASATAPTPAVRPRPSEARAARGQLIKQIANRRRSQRAA